MFNLERAIEEWKRQMAAAGFKAGDVLYELENHLREDVEEQVRAGVDAEAAFASAVRRIGAGGALKSEFVKSGGLEEKPGSRFMWGFYFVSATIAILIDVWTVVSFELNEIERVAGAWAVTLFALYVLCLPFSGWCRDDVPNARLLGMMKVAGIVVPLWILWALLTAVGVIRVEIGILPNMVMWSLCAAHGLTAVACIMNRRGSNGASGWLPPSSPLPWPNLPRKTRTPGREIPVPPTAKFSASAQKALEIAREEAVGLGHSYIGTEHLLLGMLTRGDMNQFLGYGKISVETVRAEISRLVSRLPVSRTEDALPLTPRARRALNLAGSEAGTLKQDSIGEEHIVLGLLLEGSGVAALALKNLGVRIEGIRGAILRSRRGE